jgi:hypothetical protein
MFERWHFGLRHPLYPGLAVTRAASARGLHAVLAGSFQELADAAALGARASHAVYVLDTAERPPVSPQQRERLWEWFHVPSYLLVLDSRGRLQAYECEAQQSLHVSGEAAGDLTGICACGRPGPRIASHRRNARAAAPAPLTDSVPA